MDIWFRLQQIKGLKVGQGDAWAEGLTGFLGRILAIAQTMGIALPGQDVK